MPYIVKTTEQWVTGEVGSTRNPIDTEPAVSRRAVATLDEAEAYIRDKRGALVIPAAEDLPESGGTITLPDGTVIEVEQASCDALVWRGMLLSYPTEAEIIAAYNAAQEQMA